MRKKAPTTEQMLRKYKRRFRVTAIILILFTAVAGIYIYLNYDYLAFKHFISQHYAYTDTLDELYKKELQTDVKGKYYSYFDNLVISVLTRRIREENGDRYTYLYMPEQYKKHFELEKEEALQSETKEINEKTAYIRITNFSKHTRKFLEDKASILDNYSYLVIDLRDNGGGDVEAMNKMAGMFIPKGSVISKDDMRFIDWTYKAGGGKKLQFEKIVILQNSGTASASENFIVALKDNLDNVHLLGSTTFGKGIGQFTLPLRRGYAVKATTMLWYTPNGINIQGKGIPPDITYEGDDMLKFALEQLDIIGDASQK